MSGFFMSDEQIQFTKAITFFRKYRSKAGSKLYNDILMKFCDRLENYFNRSVEEKEDEKLAANVKAALF